MLYSTNTVHNFGFIYFGALPSHFCARDKITYVADYINYKEVLNAATKVDIFMRGRFPFKRKETAVFCGCTFKNS